MAEELSLWGLLEERLRRSSKTNDNELRLATVKAELLDKFESHITEPSVGLRFEVEANSLAYVVDLINDEDVSAVYTIVQESETIFLAYQKDISFAI